MKTVRDSRVPPSSDIERGLALHNGNKANHSVEVAMQYKLPIQ